MRTHVQKQPNTKQQEIKGKKNNAKNVTKSNILVYMINKGEVILCHCFWFFVFILSFHWWRSSRSTEFYSECHQPRTMVDLSSCAYAVTLLMKWIPWKLNHYWWSKLSLMFQINPNIDSNWIVILKWFSICISNQWRQDDTLSSVHQCALRLCLSLSQHTRHLMTFPHRECVN